MEIVVTEENFDAEVLKSGKAVLVDFSATWCGPCQMIAPSVAAIAEERADRLAVGKVDVDASPALAARFGITGIPALLLFREGRVAGTLVGYASKPEIESFLDSH